MPSIDGKDLGVARDGVLIQPLLPVEFEGLARSAAEYAKGSAVRALEVEPGFDKFLFIERDADRAAELGRLMEQFPGKNIQIVNSDANSALTDWINATEWLQNRAVVFLDPFGMQVEWKLIESLARTQAIDLWILFPLFAVNRMLVRNGEPPEGWRTKLTKVFGTSDWEPAFYTRTKSLIIEGLEITEKSADIGRISEFFLSQLKRLFPAVARPLVLTNSRGAPLFLFCFAAANKKGAPTALRIAEHVIGHS